MKKICFTYIVFITFLILLVACNQENKSKKNGYGDLSADSTKVTGFPFGSKLLVTFKFPREWEKIDTSDKPVIKNELYQNRLERIRRFFDTLNRSKSIVPPQISTIKYFDTGGDSILIRNFKYFKSNFLFRLPNFGPYQCYYQYSDIPIEKIKINSPGHFDRQYLEYGNLVFYDFKKKSATVVNVFNGYTFEETIGGYNRYFFIDKDKKIQIFEAAEEETSSSIKRNKEIDILENGEISVNELN